MEANEPSESVSISPKEKVLQSESQFSHSDQLIYYKEKLSRVKGENLQNLMHQSMSALTFLDANKKINFGSGVLISRNVVLTAAQNIFNKDLNTENTDFKIYIGANGVAEEYHQAEGSRYPEEFKTCNISAKLSHNYALIKLKKPVNIQYLPLSLVCKECLLADNKKKALKLFGFPRVYLPDALGNVRSFEANFEPLDQTGEKIKLYQYGLAQKGRIRVIEAEQSKIGYRISALPGQSGCPVVVDNEIIAVHVGGDRGKLNVGRIVDVSFVDSLWKWREELNAAPFSVQDYNVCQDIKKVLNQMKYKFDLSRKKIKTVDLREYANLMELDLRSNELRQIDLVHCPRLTKLNLNYNQMQRIDLTNNKHLTFIDMSNNKLQEIDLRTNTNIAYLYLSNNQLREIDLRVNVHLIGLFLYSNKLQEMDVSANVNLTHLYLSSNGIAEINLTKNTKLEWLRLQDNRLEHVRLWIAENVQERKYTEWFNLSNHQSAVCRVQMQSEGQGQAVRQKAIRIIDKWMQKYSNHGFNKHNCAYSFFAF